MTCILLHSPRLSPFLFFLSFGSIRFLKLFCGQNSPPFHIPFAAVVDTLCAPSHAQLIMRVTPPDGIAAVVSDVCVALFLYPHILSWPASPRFFFYELHFTAPMGN